MSSRDAVTEPSGVCPACMTRLRVSLQESGGERFDCPECDAGLVVERTSDRSDAFQVTLAVSSVRRKDVPSFRNIFSGHSRLVAFFVTASVGWTILALIVPSVESEGHRRLDRAAETPVQPAADAEPETHESGEPKHQIVRGDDEFPDVGRSPVVPDTEVRSTVDMTRAQSGASDDSSASKVSSNLESGRPAGRENSPDDSLGGSIPSEPVLPRAPLTGGRKVAAAKEERKPSTVAVVNRPEVAETMNLTQRLEIPIQRLRITDSLPFQDVVRMVEQMCRIQIDVSTVSKNELERGVTLELQETTPIEILSAAARKNGLRVTVNETSVMIVAED